MTMAARVPHFHYVEEIRCGALAELKASFQNKNSDPSIKHTFLPVLVKSLSMALNKYPLLNSCFNEDMHEIVVKGLYKKLQIFSCANLSHLHYIDLRLGTSLCS